MTAAAERAVTFGSCFYRWTARLLSCLGSSAAQGIGGRVIAAPTGGACLRRAGVLTRPYGGTWKLSLVWAGVCMPRGHPHPALRATFPLGGGRLTGGPVCRPYEIWETLRPFRWGRFQTGQRAHTVRPYGGKRAGIVGSAKPGAGAESHQSQISSCSGPQWGRAEPHPTTPDFARRKDFASFKG